jgi:methylthioribose-1-phosphate isomerase
MTDAIDYARYDRIRPIRWTGDALELLDQRKLPFTVEYLTCRTADEVAAAIHALAVRGAPAIGISAAWGVVLAARDTAADDAADAAAKLEPVMQRLNAARIRASAQARFTAVGRAALLRAQAGEGSDDWRGALEAEARAIETEDLAANHAMGILGASLIAPGSGVLTHCNTGSLAKAGFGTALGVIRAGQGTIGKVFAGETRPWQQGARLTAWELLQDGIPATLIADSAAAHLMKTGAVQWVVVGADRICANGDTANKIGTYQLAIAARHHGAKFMVVAPSSTVDMDTASGELIEIEERDPSELFGIGGTRTVAEGVPAWNPVFDVTPAGLIDAIVTEKGVVAHPDTASMRALFAG